MAKTIECCRFRIENIFIREFLAEFLGTFVLVTFGNGSVAQSVLSLQTKGNFFSINWGWGIGVFLGMVISSGVSGGHLNPAVSVALASLGKLPWRKVPHYLAGQYLGAFTASCTVFLAYWDGLVWYEHDRGAYRSIPETAAIFSTYPSPHLSYIGGIGDQFLGTFLLLVCICAVSDSRNMPEENQLIRVPLVTGCSVLGLGISLGYNCGYAVNPARDLAPRVFSALTGWGPGVFSAFNHWWVVPVVACHLGAVAGAWLYYMVVERNWTESGKKVKENITKKRKKKEDSMPKMDISGPGTNYLQYANLYHQNEVSHPPAVPGHTATFQSIPHSRPHTPDDSKYQPVGWRDKDR